MAGVPSRPGRVPAAVVINKPGRVPDPAALAEPLDICCDGGAPNMADPPRLQGRVPAATLLGHGNYFAADAAKADQYVDPLSEDRGGGGMPIYMMRH